MPEGIGHGPDLSKLSFDQQAEHHRKQLHAISFHQGIGGVTAYKRAYPQAAGIRVSLNALAYVPKPKGYGDQLTNMVGRWFQSDAALASTNRADVEQLNLQLGTTRFDPDRHFSKPLSAGILRKLGAVFEQHGAHLDASKANTMAKVRRAVRVAKAATQPTAQSFAGVGTRSSDAVTIGDCSFPVERHHGHDCIRIPVDGTRVRMRLDALAQLVALSGLRAGEETGGVPDYLLHSNIGELAPDPATGPEADPLDDIPQGNWPRAPGSNPASLVGELAPDCLPERIRRLVAARPSPPLPAHGADADPLEI